MISFVKMRDKMLNFNNIEVNQKKFNDPKKQFVLNLVNIEKKVISEKFKHNDKDFISCKDDNIIRPLCIVLLQMSGYIKFFDNDGKIYLF